jgi:hypothetical protein
MYTANQAVLTFFLPYKKPCIAYQNNSITTSYKVEICCNGGGNLFREMQIYLTAHTTENYWS